MLLDILVTKIAVMTVSAGFRTYEALGLLSYEVLTWALKEVDPVGLHRQSGIHAPEN
jgi:hypothetical protein